jgi:hypothetical protein
LEANRPQLEPRHRLCHRPAVAHPSAATVSLRFQSRKGTYGARFKRHYILIIFKKAALSLKLRSVFTWDVKAFIYLLSIYLYICNYNIFVIWDHYFI